MSRRVFTLGNRCLIGYLAFMGAFAPLSTDMFLPALPNMTAAMHTTASLTSLTVSGFLLVFALSMLVWGALSDKYGRKPVLFAGFVLYVISSAAIALTDTIVSLLIWRAVQALGSAAISAMALAIVKDVLRGSAMERVVTLLQTVTILAPMCAPVVGGVILLFTDWRGVFWCLTGCGLVGFAGLPALSETLSRPTQGSVFQVFSRIPFVLRNTGFSALLLTFSAVTMPIMAYIAVSTYVFQSVFQLSAQAYSAFFAFNAAMSLAGPLLHIRFFKHADLTRVITGYLLITCLAGVALVCVGGQSAWAFALLYAPISCCTSAIRPPSTVLMMNQLRTDNGTVTALINSGGLLLGSLAMLLCSLPFWGSFILATGAISFAVGGLALWAWFCMNRRQVFAY